MEVHPECEELRRLVGTQPTTPSDALIIKSGYNQSNDTVPFSTEARRDDLKKFT